MKCRPFYWLLGLIPVIGLFAYTLFAEKGNIESDLSGRMQTKLQKLGLGWAKPSFDGRDGTLTGLTLEENNRVKAAAKVSDIYGVRILDDKTGLTPAVHPYIWSAKTKDKTLTLDGYVPSSQTAKTINKKAQTLFPGYTITDNTKIARGVASKEWIGQTGFSLAQLQNLRSGETQLSDNDFSISGRASSSQNYETVKHTVHTGLTNNLNLKKDTVLPPVASPYKWSLLQSESDITLDGFVPDEATRKALHARIKEHYPNRKIIDNTKVADGAPENWLESASLAASHTAKLQEGKAVLIDKNAEISGTVANYNMADKKTANYLASAKTTGFTHSAKIASLTPRVPTASPYTWMAASKDDELILQGHVPGDKARQSLLQTAKKRFPNKKITDQMTIAKGQPKNWLRASRQGLIRLSTLEHGTASLSDKSFGLTGSAKNKAVKDKLKPVAPKAGFLSSFNVTAPKPIAKPKPAPVVEAAPEVPTDNITGADSAKICESLIGSFLNKEKINFQTAKATISQSSYGLLNKLARIISKCPETAIQINGHTDSDGGEAGNLNLSSKRATAVYNYLVQKGIEATRLKAKGFGESTPLVPNDSPANKAKNRRIEFKLSTN